MCGLVWLKRNDGYSPVKPLLARYEEQKSRGQQGFGFVAVKKDTVIGYERATTEEEIREKLSKYHDATEIMMHHRFPTSTKNLEETAHPIFVSNELLKNDYYVIHNGVISNPDILKKEHENLGFKYNTEVELFAGYKQKHGRGKKKNKQRIEITRTEFNDSEALAIEFALYNEGIKPKVEARGSIAFIAYEVDKKTNKIKKMHYARNTNPINAFRAHGMFVLSSESTDKGHVSIESGKLITIDYDTKDKSNNTTIKQIDLGTSFSNSGYSSRGVSTNSTSDTFRYRQLNEDDTDNTIGFDTTRKNIADDVCDEDRESILLLKEPTKTCEHNSMFPESCARCLSKATVRTVFRERCDETSNYVDECMCEKHKQDTTIRNLLNKSKDIPSPYQNESDLCPVCKDKLGPRLFLNKIINMQTHYECTEKTPSVLKVDSNGMVAGRLSKRYSKFEEEIAELESLIDNLEQEVFELEQGGSNAEDWLKKTCELEDTQKKLDTTQRNANKLWELIKNIPF